MLQSLRPLRVIIRAVKWWECFKSIFISSLEFGNFTQMKAIQICKGVAVAEDGEWLLPVGRLMARPPAFPVLLQVLCEFWFTWEREYVKVSVVCNVKAFSKTRTVPYKRSPFTIIKAHYYGPWDGCIVGNLAVTKLKATLEKFANLKSVLLTCSGVNWLL